MSQKRLTPTSNQLSLDIFTGLQHIDSNESWELFGPVIKSRECHIYRAEAQVSKLVLAIKHYSTAISTVAPKQQFEAFQRYQCTMTADDVIYKVPQTYYLNQKKRLLYCEWILGKKLHDHLWTLQKKNLQSSYLKQAGRWLRHFHDAGEIEQTTVSFAKNLNAIQRQLNLRQQRTDNSVMFNEAYKVLKKMITQNSNKPAIQASLHGDFTPSNLILRDQQVTGIDIWATSQGSIYNDIARMVTYLIIAYPLLINGQVFDTNEQLNSRLLPLFEGYGSDRADFTATEFHIVLLAELLRRWLVIGGRKSSLPGCITDPYQIIRINQQLESLTALLSNKRA